VALRTGALEVELAPGLGGSIVRFDRLDPSGGRQPLLRGGGEDIDDVLEAGCFPLVPFVNRIRGGRFVCDGRTVTLAPNLPGDASPLHGQGWRGAWSAVEQDERRTVLAFRHEAGEWPWAYEARQEIDLDEHGLSLTLSCRNLSPERMPCGLGLHPYYPCVGETVLDTLVESAWTIDAAVLPVANVPAAGRYDLRQRRICGQSLDNGFDGWCGRATITWPRGGASLRLTSPDARRFQVYSPKEGGLFVAEPVQNANAALNEPQERWPELGIAMLEQGEERLLHARFEVVDRVGRTGGKEAADD
jgi:aldose 1-epimerase